MKRYFYHFYLIFRNLLSEDKESGNFNKWDLVKLFTSIIFLCGIGLYYIECNEIEEYETLINVSSTQQTKLHISNMHYVYDYGGDNDCIYKTLEECKSGFYIRTKVEPCDTIKNAMYKNIGEILLPSKDAKDSIKFLTGIIGTSIYNKGIISPDYQICNSTLSTDLDVVELVQKFKNDKVSHPEYIGAFLKFSISTSNEHLFLPSKWYLLKDECSINYIKGSGGFVSDSINGNYIKKSNTREKMTSTLIVFAPTVELLSLAPIPIKVNLSSYNPKLMWARDVSQATHKLGFGNSDNVQLVIDTLTFDYKGVVSFSNIYPRPDLIGASFIQYTDSAKLASIVSQGLHFGSKNPNMENKVLIKMFVLTGLITALFSFVCSLLIKLFKPLCIRFFKKCKIFVWLAILLTWGLLTTFIIASI